MSLASFGALAGLSALGIGGSMVGSGVSSAASYDYAKRLMKRQFAYQKQIMQSKHQWEVDDLRNAGLNPILSANGGSALGVSQGSVAVPPVDFNPMSYISTWNDLQNSAQARRLSSAQVDSTRNSAAKVKTEKDIAEEQLKQERLKTDYIKSNPTYFAPARSIFSEIFPRVEYLINSAAKSRHFIDMLSPVFLNRDPSKRRDLWFGPEGTRLRRLGDYFLDQRPPYYKEDQSYPIRLKWSGKE